MALESLSNVFAANWRVTLKLSTMAMSGMLGVVAMLNDFKDKNGRLTRWGRVNLSAVVLSALVGVVLEVAATQEQNEKDAAAKAAAVVQLRRSNEQIQRSVEANEKLGNVLQTSLKVQAAVGRTLEEQSRILTANQQTSREVERGFTPLGSRISVEYELLLPGDNPRFAQLQDVVKQEIDKFQARMNAGEDFPYRQAIYGSSYSGMEIKASILQKTITGVEMSSSSVMLQGVGGWPSQTMTGAPFHLKVWKKRPAISECKVSAAPDAEFAANLAGEQTSTDARKDGTGGPMAMDSIRNEFNVAAKSLSQVGTVNLGRRVVDNGAIQSPMDLEGGLVDVMLALVLGGGRAPDDPGASFTFKQLTIYAGHYTIKLDTEHPTVRCGSDIYFVLPSRLSAPG